MPTLRWSVAAPLLSALFLSGCGSSPEASSGGQSAGSPAPAAATAKKPVANADGTLPSGPGVEKEPPAAGKGNVQGRVLFNEKPAAGIEVKLCETFSRFVGGGGGETFKTKTDANGEYLLKNVTPRVYEGLLVKVFDSNYYVFATSGIMRTAKYPIEPGKTYFAPDTNLFKSDLKLLAPKAGSKMAAEALEVKWKPYPDAAYYKFSINADTASGAVTDYDYINKRVEGESYALDKPLAPGEYRCTVTAYNANEVKLAESPSDIEFRVMPGAK
ncbi:MAG: hypothetical protein K0Q72_50 [Armatimonadetes bacterium]|nr:hypothetical protein [Armatimonadota bacterium]